MKDNTLSIVPFTQIHNDWIDSPAFERLTGIAVKLYVKLRRVSYSQYKAVTYTIQSLAQHIGASRTTTYKAIDELVKEGMLVSEKKQGKYKFSFIFDYERKEAEPDRTPDVTRESLTKHYTYTPPTVQRLAPSVQFLDTHVQNLDTNKDGILNVEPQQTPATAAVMPDVVPDVVPLPTVSEPEISPAILDWFSQYGITHEIATALIRRHRPNNLDDLRNHVDSKQRTIANPAGYIRRAIEQHWTFAPKVLHFASPTLSPPTPAEPEPPGLTEAEIVERDNPELAKQARELIIRRTGQDLDTARQAKSHVTWLLAYFTELKRLLKEQQLATEPTARAQ